MNLPIPAPLSAPADPAFDRARYYGEMMRAGVSMSLAAPLLIGTELARLRDLYKPTHGVTPDGLEWKERVEQQTGFGREFCRRAEKAAADVLLRLSGKRDKESRAVRDLLTRTDGHTPSYDDLRLLSTAVGKEYDADTWTGLLQEIGIIRPTVRALPGSAEIKRLPLAEEARIAALGFLRNLRHAAAHGETWRRRLATLPLEPTGDPDRPSLLEIKSEIEAQAAEIDGVIRRKMN